MTTSKDMRSLAKLCRDGAHEVLEQLLALGPRPNSPEAAVLLWDQSHLRLMGQMNSLTAMGAKLAASSVVEALESAEVDLKQLREVTKLAGDRIKKVKDVSKLLTSLGRVLDLGLAVLAFAAAPGTGTAEEIVNKVIALADDVAAGEKENEVL